jgi:hypothetical protein
LNYLELVDSGMRVIQLFEISWLRKFSPLVENLAFDNQPPSSSCASIRIISAL